MNHISTFNNIVTIISFVVNITFFIPFVLKLYSYFTNIKYIKYVLGFSNEKAQIKNSIFHLSEPTGTLNNFITYSSLQSINNVVNLLNAVNQEFSLIDNGLENRNEINIGGFMTNKSVNAYFIKYFKNFKYVTNIKYKNTYDQYPINKQVIEYASEKFGFKIDNKVFLEAGSKISDYAFLIKLTKSDFKDDNEKTVHIIFGGTDIGTVKASEFLYSHCKQIYSKYKKNHYFFAIEINRTDDSINYTKGIIDLTDIMFNDSPQ